MITTPIRVRYCECDPGGIAHHSVYPTWFEIGRTDLLRAQNISYRDIEASGVFMVVAHLAVQYKKPAQYDDELVLTTTVQHIGRARLEHAYTLARNNIIITTGSTTLACIDRSGRVQPVPDVIADAFAGASA
ncbi:MAG: acyl-CoA thioesterase [Phycisphaerales bacterium]